MEMMRNRLFALAICTLSASLCGNALCFGQNAPPKEQKEGAVATEKKPAWLGSKEGISDKVMPPWTPIEVKRSGDRLEVMTWGRSYIFDGTVFPTKVQSNGADLLAGPMALRAKVDGEEIAWKPGAIKMQENGPARVCWSQAAEAANGKLAVSVKTAVEYDGMIRMDWKLDTHVALRLDELTVEIPVKSECAQLMYCFPDYNKRHFTGCGAVPNEGFKTAFTPFVWIGDYGKGLQWFAETDEQWSNATPGQVIEIACEGGATVLRLHVISVPAQITPAVFDVPFDLSYTFGLMATPVKPITKDGWDYRATAPPNYRQDYWLLREDKKVGDQLQLDYLAGLGVKSITLFNWWDDLSFVYVSPVKRSDDLHALVKACHAKGIQVLPYFGTWSAQSNPGWDIFGEKVKVIPDNTISVRFKGQPVSPSTKACLHSVWQDFLVYQIARMMDEYGIDGVYLDGLVTPWPCENQLHGCGYTTADGTVHPTWPIFATCDALRRIYTVVKSRNPDGQVSIHTSSAMPIPCLAWGTSHWSGEHFKKGAYDLQEDETALPSYSMWLGKQWGVPAELLFYTRFGNSFEGYLKASAYSLLLDVPTRAHNSAYLSYDDVKLESALWRLFDEFGRKDAEWIPYWRSAEYVTLAPKGVYASLYKHPKNGVLAVISNLSKDTATIHVQFHPEKLGLQPNPNVLDALSRGPLYSENGLVDLSLAHLGWQIVWLK
jgi:hypothetical protein